MTHARLEKKPYIPLDKDALLDSTTNLQQTFNAFAKLYFPPDYKTLRGEVQVLEANYLEQVKSKSKSGWRLTTPVADQTRLDQIACIKLLVERLPEKPDNEATLKQAHMILLGALLYRYLRIESSYTSGYGIFGSADNSALKVVLFKLLNLGENNIPDQQTIATCCGEYRNYLKQNDNVERYSYIKKDHDFFVNLDSIIDTATIKAKSVNDKIKYILFIQSVPALLNRNEDIINQNICKRLDEWIVGELKQKTVLTFIDVKLCLDNMTGTELSIRNYFEAYFLAEDLEITAETRESFKTEIMDNMKLWYQYAILGAYFMCIEECKPSSKSELSSLLYQTFESAIGSKAETYLDNKTRDNALTALKKFVELSTEPLLNLEVWGGMDLFIGALKTQLHAVHNPPEEIAINALTI